MKKSKPQFKDLQFKSEKKFNNWLNKNTFKRIHLKDVGLDILTIWIYNTGEILHCDFHSRIYNGRFVDLSKLNIGDSINIWDKDKEKYIVYSGLVIESIDFINV